MSISKKAHFGSQNHFDSHQPKTGLFCFLSTKNTLTFNKYFDINHISSLTHHILEGIDHEREKTRSELS